jgi:hypothetical protein
MTESCGCFCFDEFMIRFSKSLIAGKAKRLTVSGQALFLPKQKRHKQH